MKTYVNIILKNKAALKIKALKNEAKILLASKLGGLSPNDIEVLVWDEPEDKGHAIDVNGNCNKGCC